MINDFFSLGIVIITTAEAIFPHLLLRHTLIILAAQAVAEAAQQRVQEQNLPQFHVDKSLKFGTKV